jgi:hypothetical protein
LRPLIRFELLLLQIILKALDSKLEFLALGILYPPEVSLILDFLSLFDNKVILF